MEVLGWALWAVGLLLGLSWAYGVRTYVRAGRGIQQATVNQALLGLASVVAVPMLGLSPFHLLWLLPVAFIVGMLSLAFPFSLVSLVGKPFGHLCCLGLDRDEVARNTARVERFRELVMAGISPEEAKQQLDREGGSGAQLPVAAEGPLPGPRLNRSGGRSPSRAEERGSAEEGVRRRIPLVRAVELTSGEVFGTSVGQVRDLIVAQLLPESLGTNPDEFNRTAWDLILELMIFSIHLADRIAFDVLGSDRRAKFMDALVARMASNLASSILTDKSEHAQRSFEDHFIQLCNLRTTFYARLSLPASGAPLKGTLFWEAGKLAAGEHFSESAPDAVFLLPSAFGSCVSALKDLRGRLEQLADA